MVFGVNFVPMPRDLSPKRRGGLEVGDDVDKLVFDAEIFAEIYKLPVRFPRKNKPDAGSVFNPRSDAEKINLRAAPFEIVPNIDDLPRFRHVRFLIIFRLQVFG